MFESAGTRIGRLTTRGSPAAAAMTFNYAEASRAAVGCSRLLDAEAIWATVLPLRASRNTWRFLPRSWRHTASTRASRPGPCTRVTARSRRSSATDPHQTSTRKSARELGRSRSGPCRRHETHRSCSRCSRSTSDRVAVARAQRRSPAYRLARLSLIGQAPSLGSASATERAPEPRRKLSVRQRESLRIALFFRRAPNYSLSRQHPLKLAGKHAAAGDCLRLSW
jgi:hypothetical protein